MEDPLESVDGGKINSEFCYLVKVSFTNKGEINVFSQNETRIICRHQTQNKCSRTFFRLRKNDTRRLHSSSGANKEH